MHFRWLLLFITLFALIVPREALAQAITITGPKTNPHEGLAQLTVSTADCGVQLEYTLTGVAAGEEIAVWATLGSDLCEENVNRSGTTQSCREVKTLSASGTSATVIVTPREVATALAQGDMNLDANCADGSNADFRSVTIYFLIDPENADPVAKFGTTPLRLDFNGPAAPTLTSLGPNNETTLIAEFTGATGTDATGYQLYCVARGTAAAREFGPDGVAGAAGAAGGGGMGGASGGMGGGGIGGAGGEAGSGGSGANAGSGGTAGSGGSAGNGGSGGSGGGDCASDVLVPGKEPDAMYKCGSEVGATDTSAVTSDLAADQEYVIGVAAVDGVGNVGSLSNLLCSAPQPVDDFFEKYREAGGKGDGCGCHAVGLGAHPVGAAGAWLLGLGVLRYRRRRAQ